MRLYGASPGHLAKPYGGRPRLILLIVAIPWGLGGSHGKTSARGLDLATWPHFQHQTMSRAVAKVWEGWARLLAAPMYPENSLGARDFLLHRIRASLVLSFSFIRGRGQPGGMLMTWGWSPGPFWEVEYQWCSSSEGSSQSRRERG